MFSFSQDLTKFLRVFNHSKCSLLSLLIIYSCKKLIMLGFIPLISMYLWKAFLSFSSKTLQTETIKDHDFVDLGSCNIKSIKLVHQLPEGRTFISKLILGWIIRKGNPHVFDSNPVWKSSTSEFQTWSCLLGKSY